MIDICQLNGLSGQTTIYVQLAIVKVYLVPKKGISISAAKGSRITISSMFRIRESLLPQRHSHNGMRISDKLPTHKINAIQKSTLDTNIMSAIHTTSELSG